jgi:hypothetical protein
MTLMGSKTKIDNSLLEKGKEREKEKTSSKILEMNCYR